MDVLVGLDAVNGDSTSPLLQTQMTKYRALTQICLTAQVEAQHFVHYTHITRVAAVTSQKSHLQAKLEI